MRAGKLKDALTFRAINDSNDELTEKIGIDVYEWITGRVQIDTLP